MRILVVLCIIPIFFYGATNAVTSNSDDPAVAGTLPYWILNSAAGDTIDCSGINGQTITLSQSLPAITENLSVASGSGNNVTINGGNLYQGFSFAAGTTVALSNFTLLDCASIGGSGGTGEWGGGGGAGGGGGLYVHPGVSLTTSALIFNSDVATGGAGESGSGIYAGGVEGGGWGGLGHGLGRCWELAWRDRRRH